MKRQVLTIDDVPSYLALTGETSFDPLSRERFLDARMRIAGAFVSTTSNPGFPASTRPVESRRLKSSWARGRTRTCHANRKSCRLQPVG